MRPVDPMGDCPVCGPRAAWARHGAWGRQSAWRWRNGKPPKHFFFLRVLFLFLAACGILVFALSSNAGSLHSFLGHLGLVFLVFFIVGLVLKRLFRPMRRLMLGVQEISDGNLDFRFPLRGHGEFDYLADHFNLMVDNIREMVRSKDQLLLDVSHELRSPLTRMKVALEMAPKGKWRKDMERDIVEMEAMLGEVLESERLRSGNGKLDLRPLDPGKLLVEFARRYKGRKPGVKKAGPFPLVEVQADEARIRTVLQNVLENALKYSAHQKKPVELGLSGGENGIVLEVRDHGEGIPAAERERVFEPFYRVDKSRAKATGGYGLGLHLSREIMRAHGGDITLECPPDGGTKVSVLVPKT